MIVDERLVTYINSLDTGNTAMLDQIEREATADYVPIIRKEMQSFLKFLLAMKKPAIMENTVVKITHINNASNAFAVGAIAEKSNT